MTVTDTAPLTLALYSAICVRHDAISDSLRRKLDLVAGLAAKGAPVRATAFVNGTDIDDPRIRVARSPVDLVLDPAFRAARVHIFEVSMHYDLFNAIFLLPPTSVALAIYHSETPVELIDVAPVRESVAQALLQKHNLALVHHVACDSEFSRDELSRFGIADEQLSVLHLPPSVPPPQTPASLPRSGSVRFLFVGRLVRSKGVLDLLDAAANLRDAGVGPFEVSVTGNAVFSDPEVVDAVRRKVADAGLHDIVTLHGETERGRLAELYATADALVIPSYHEGYCVPVVEAMAAGCYVIGYDAGNLPNVIGDVGTTVPAGDIGALTATMASFVTRLTSARRDGDLTLPTPAGELAAGAWRQAVSLHLEDYSPEAYEAGFLRLLHGALEASSGDVPDWLSAAVASTEPCRLT